MSGDEQGDTKEQRIKQKRKPIFKSPPTVDYAKYPVFSQCKDPEIKKKLLLVQEYMEDVRTQLNTLELSNQKMTKTINVDLQSLLSKAERIFLEEMTSNMCANQKIETLQNENSAVKEELNFLMTESNAKFDKIHCEMETMNKNMEKSLKEFESTLLLRDHTKGNVMEKTETKAVEELGERDRVYQMHISNLDEYKGDWKADFKKVAKNKNLNVAIKDVVEYTDKEGDDYMLFKSDDKKELDKIVKFIKNDKEMYDKIWYSAPSCRHYKITLLGMMCDVSECVIQDQIMNVLVNDRPEWHRFQISVFKRFRRKDELENVVLKVDAWTMQELLKRRKICIEFVRVRIVKFINLVRCFRCQEHGHVSDKCKGEIACAKCGGPHDIKKCESGIKYCVNCKNNSHSSNNTICPIYLEYKKKRLAE